MKNRTNRFIENPILQGGDNGLSAKTDRTDRY